jgi:excisionase family DNA binding protein
MKKVDCPVARRFLTMEEAAAYVGVCSKQIGTWIREAGLPVIRVGSRVVRIDQRDLDGFMLRYRVGAQEDERAAKDGKDSRKQAVGNGYNGADHG